MLHYRALLISCFSDSLLDINASVYGHSGRIIFLFKRLVPRHFRLLSTRHIWTSDNGRLGPQRPIHKLHNTDRWQLSSALPMFERRMPLSTLIQVMWWEFDFIWGNSFEIDGRVEWLAKIFMFNYVKKIRWSCMTTRRAFVLPLNASTALPHQHMCPLVAASDDRWNL